MIITLKNSTQECMTAETDKSYEGRRDSQRTSWRKRHLNWDLKVKQELNRGKSAFQTEEQVHRKDDDTGTERRSAWREQKTAKRSRSWERPGNMKNVGPYPENSGPW